VHKLGCDEISCLVEEGEVVHQADLMTILVDRRLTLLLSLLHLLLLLLHLLCCHLLQLCCKSLYYLLQCHFHCLFHGKLHYLDHFLQHPLLYSQFLCHLLPFCSHHFFHLLLQHHPMLQLLLHLLLLNFCAERMLSGGDGFRQL